MSDTAKPNQQTAVVRAGTNKKNGLLEFKPIPETLPKERVGGVVLDVKLAHDFKTSNAARIDVVMQSSADHWISIGSIPFNELSTEWKTVRVEIEDHAHLESMQWLYSIRLLLSDSTATRGEIYINDAGVILR